MKKSTQVLVALVSMMGLAYCGYKDRLFERRPKIIAFYVNVDEKGFESLRANIQNLDQVMPMWIHLSGPDGSIAINDQEDQKKVLAFIGQQKRKILITPLINNVNLKTQNWDGEMLAAMLKNPKARSKNIQALLDFVQANHLDGINIDYESVPDASQKDLVLFMRELYNKFHPLGLEVTKDVPLKDESFNVGELSRYCDHLILMAYDEHMPGLTSAGPIASQKWFEEGVEKKISQIGSGKIIVALGGYAYDWRDGGISGKALTFQEAMNIASRTKSRITFDKETQNPTYDYRDENGDLHRVWFLDARTLSNEMNATRGDVYGCALWRLGSEDPLIWKVFKRKTE